MENILREVRARVESEREQMEKPAETELEKFNIKTALNQNEDGDARLFVALNRGRLIYDHAAGCWYEWAGHHWRLDEKEKALAGVAEVAEAYLTEFKSQAWARAGAEKAGNTKWADAAKAMENALAKRVRELQTVARKQNVLHLARAGENGLGITGTEWDASPWALGCKNGVINLRTGDIWPGRPEEFIKMVAPVEYHGLDTPAPSWERFIDGIFDADESLVAFVRRLLGYALTGQTTEHIAPIFYGEGRNGKSTLVEAARYVMGDYAGTIESEMLLMQRFSRQSGGPSPDIMSLRGKRFCYCSETESGRQFNISRLKWLSGGDTLVGREPYGKRLVTFSPTHKIFLSTNNRPRANADDYAFWKRALLIPFNLSFVDEPREAHERQADAELLPKLKAEAPGILAWMVRGCLEWQKWGLNPPETVKAATQAYRDAEDTIKNFLNECCTEGATNIVRAGALFDAYRKWCEQNSEQPVTATKFGKYMGKKYDSSKDNSGKFYMGLGFS